MPEIKHTFQAGKMNKDLDERIVPNGEYRDALNVQIRTTDGDSIGTVQNIKSTKEMWDGSDYYEAWMGTANSYGEISLPEIIGSVANEKTDKIYFFIRSPFLKDTLDLFTGGQSYSTAQGETVYALGDQIDSERNFVDCIVEYDTISQQTTPIVVDKYAILNTFAEVGATHPEYDMVEDGNQTQSTYAYTCINVLDASKYRVGMRVRALSASGNDLFNVGGAGGYGPMKIKSINGNRITFHRQVGLELFYDTGAVSHFLFEHEDRPLNFSEGNVSSQIIAANIIDNLLFWTDNRTEPKKINIDRCRQGTTSDYKTHTELIVSNNWTSQNDDYSSILNADPGLSDYPYNKDLKEEHVTVIRKAPRYAPTIHMDRNDRVGLTDGTAQGFGFAEGLSVGDQVVITQDDFIETQWRSDDIVIFTQTDADAESNPVVVKVKFMYYEDYCGIDTCAEGDAAICPTNGQPASNSGDCQVTDRVRFKILSFDPALTQYMYNWSFKLEQRKPLYELKMGRFAFRYKYVDGEYSTFSPWSELAFMPDKFDYESKKAYNLGMVNSIRKLVIKDFIPYPRPLDVEEIDLLWKDTVSPSVYVVTSMKRGIDKEWSLFDASGSILKTGELTITSEAIHRVLSSGQALRIWDNVPRFAKAQEIVANRLVYANYVQGYNFSTPVAIKQSIQSDNSPSLNHPQKSIKTLRDYKFGTVFGDKYGRETPVIASGYTHNVFDEDNNETTIAVTGDLNVPKTLCAKKNKFMLQQMWDSYDPSEWMEYVKYYVKEPSTEYYNLIMDRWYWAEDEQRNVWLSFNSADRNKVDEETYLILKNKHNSQVPVLDKARYKIIAIKNDAPNYVKTDRLLIGNCEISYAGSGIAEPNDTYPNPEPGACLWEYGDVSGNLNGPGSTVGSTGAVTVGKTTKRISVALVHWNIGIGLAITGWDGQTPIFDPREGGVLGRQLKGKLKVRIVGRYNNRELYTSWKTVTNHRVLSSQFTISINLDVLEFSFSEPWGDQIDMYTRFVNLDDSLSLGDTLPGLQYRLEVREDVEDHKAEFDGKFFVKLEGDGVIAANIIGASGIDVSYIPKRTYPIRYVSSYRDNEGEEVGGQYTSELNFQTNAEAQGDISSVADGSYWGAWNTGGPLDNLYFGGLETFSGVQGPHAILGPAGLLCDQSSHTKFFWQQYRTQGGSEVEKDVSFIDSFQLKYGKMEEGGEMTPAGSIENYVNADPDYGVTPISMDPGVIENEDGTIGAQNGIGRMTISYLGDVGGEPNDLKDDLTTVGTIFRWSEDPNSQNIYRVVAFWLNDTELASGKGRNLCGTGGYANTDVDNYQDPIQTGYCTSNEDEGDEIDVCERYTYQVEFRKIELFTDELLLNGTQGMDVSTYDPRSHMRHWGEGSQNIEIMEIMSNTFTEMNAVRDGAVWETEPKESTELDIYHEASNAIPMVLNEDNIYHFSPINSDVGVISGTNEYFIPNTNLYRAWVGYEHENYAVVHIRTRNTTTGAWSNTNIINVDDYIKFKHNDGTVTRSIVKHRMRYADDSLQEDTSDSTFVRIQGVISDVNSNNASNTEGDQVADLGFIDGGEDANTPNNDNWDQAANDNSLFLWTHSSYTTTITNDDGVDVTVPRVFLTRNDTAWGGGDGCDGCYNQLVNELESFQTPVLINQIYNAAQGGFDSFPFINGLNVVNPPDDGLIITGIAPEFDVSSSLTIYNQTLYNWALSTSNEQSSQTLAPQDLDSDGVADLGFACMIEVTLNDYSLFPLDGDSNSQNYGEYMGVLWNISDLVFTGTGLYAIDTKVWQYPIELGWFNCYTFGNGVESDRVRDDYNAPQMDNGVRVSTTFSGYGREQKGSGMIYSGLYNSTSEVNNLNQFNQSEKITKDLNPSYGSIQALKTRDSDLVALAEDKVLKVLASKDALFNADGNPQLTATDKVLGVAIPFSGDYGISQNPESLAWDQFRLYFTDKQRGAVLRLSRDGLTPISNVGMKSWFRENLRKSNNLLGTFDTVNGEYNLTVSYKDNQYEKDSYGTETLLTDKTVSFNEGAKGWVSFKSFIPKTGKSVSGKYITADNYKIHDHYHYDTITYNNFYGTAYESSIKLLFNDMPGSIKSFKTINYEGSQSKVSKHSNIDNATNSTTISDSIGNTITNLSDGEYYNLSAKEGWYVDSFETDLQSGKVPEFIEKEGKWFNKISGITTTIDNLDESEFSVQGIGQAVGVFIPPAEDGGIELWGGIWSITNFEEDSEAQISGAG